MTRSLISISLMRFPLSLAHGGATYSVCSLPPCGQGNRIWVNKYESLTERTESKSSEIPVLFTHMRLPCPQGGGERTEYVAPLCVNLIGKRSNACWTRRTWAEHYVVINSSQEMFRYRRRMIRMLTRRLKRSAQARLGIAALRLSLERCATGHAARLLEAQVSSGTTVVPRSDLARRSARL